MILDEAIKHAEEVAVEQNKLCKRYDDASGYSRSHNEAIRTTDAKRCEECASEHRQLAEWLKDYKRLKEQEPCEDCISRQAAIDTIESWLSCDDYNEAERHIMRAMQSVLYDLPSVNPQKPKSECEHDHEILKAYSDGANAVLDNIRAEIESKYKSIPETFHHYETGFTDALEWVLSIIDSYKAEEGKG